MNAGNTFKNTISKGENLLLTLYLNDDQAEQLERIVELYNDPDVGLEEYANEAFSDLLAKIWHEVTENILN